MELGKTILSYGVLTILHKVVDNVHKTKYYK